MSKGTYHLFFGNLSSPLRISIISALKCRDMSVNELADELSEEQSKLSHALSNLKKCNIVSVKKKGKERIYSLNKKTILPILVMIDEHAKLNCDGNCKACMRGVK